MAIRAAFAAGMLLALLSANAMAAQKKLDKTFSVSPGGQLTVVADSGNVRVTGGDSNQVVVHIEASGTEEVLNRLELSAEQTGGDVTVRAEEGRNGLVGWMRSGNRRVEVTVRVPRQYRVDLKTSGGDLSVAQLQGNAVGKTSGGNVGLNDVSGNVQMETSGGDVTADRITGNTRLKTSGGNINASAVKGDLDVNTSGGSIGLKDIDGTTKAHTSSGNFVVERVRGDVDFASSGGDIRASSIDGKIRVRTSGGNIDAELVGANRGIVASTSGGDIVLRLPKDVGGELDATTSGGSVKSELKVATNEGGENKLRGTINGGGPEIEAHTSGGSVRVKVAQQ